MLILPKFPKGTLQQVQSLVSTLDNGCMIMRGAVETNVADISSIYSISRPTIMTHRYLYSEAHPDVDMSKIRLRRFCSTPGCVNPDHYRAFVTRAESREMSTVSYRIDEQVLKELHSLEGRRAPSEDLEPLKTCLLSFGLSVTQADGLVSRVSNLLREGPSREFYILRLRIVLEGLASLSEWSVDSLHDLSKSLKFQANIPLGFFRRVVRGDLSSELSMEAERLTPDVWEKCLQNRD